MKWENVRTIILQNQNFQINTMTLLHLGYKEIIKKSIESTTFVNQYKNNIIFHRTNEHPKKKKFDWDFSQPKKLKLNRFHSTSTWLEIRINIRYESDQE